MRRLLWLASLILTTSLAYGQVLQSVGALGVALGTDKATATQTLKSKGAKLLSKQSDSEALAFKYKANYLGYPVATIGLGLADERVRLITFLYKASHLSELRTRLDEQYGKAETGDGSDAAIRYLWRIAKASGEVEAIVCLGEYQGQSLVSYVHSRLD